MKIHITLLGLLFFILFTISLQAGEYQVTSPNTRIKITVNVSDRAYYSVSQDSKVIITPSPIALTLYPDMVLGKNPEVTKQKTYTNRKKLHPVVRQKNAVIMDHYNELSIGFKGNYKLLFRAYDDAVAWRWVLNKKGKFKVKQETVSFHFSGNHNIYFPTEKSFQSHQERMYEYLPLQQIQKGTFSSLPALVEIKEGPKLVIMEADLEDYPGLYLEGTAGNGLMGLFPGYPLEEEKVDLGKRGGDRNIQVLEYADYIARINGKRSLPWRVVAIANKDKDLIHNEIIFKLAKPLQLKDTAWIKPGKVAWDWWNFNNVYSVNGHPVNFKAGVNTETYKYFIDFAAQYKIPYVILDEGWYELGDLMKINRDMDMEAIMTHARKKNVGIILWVIWKTLDDQLQEALQKFAAWGVKGIKVDFMQRDDQPMVNYYYKIAKAAAQYKLLVDFHGSYTPRGMRRAYPNVITREGVKGLENYKWKSPQGPEHEVTIPFIRMVSGPLDFTPGAMINVQQKNYSPMWQRPMSKGTRCRQLAMYVVYESPLQMLADSPSNYYKEQECMAFLAAVPVVWDETRCLKAKVGDYIAVARRKGKEWYLGAMTDWDERDMELKMDFLDQGGYEMEIFQDGANAHRRGIDYKRVKRTIKKGDTIKIHLAPGGGWAARINRLPGPN